MIKVYAANEAPKLVRKYLSADDDVFIKARDFFRRNKDIRHHKVVVYKDEEPLYCLGWMKNNPVNVDKNNPMVQMSLSNYWVYSTEDEGLDYSYVDRFGFFLFGTGGIQLSYCGDDPEA